MSRPNAKFAAPVEVAHVVRGEGPPLLLIAGTGFPGATWPPEVIAPLARRFAVITFDHRGTGWTPSTPGAYTTRLFAADTLALLRRLRLGPAHVLGHSMGGRVAQWLALDAPEATRSLVLAASGPGRFRDDQTFARGVPPQTQEAIRRLGYEGYMRRHIPEMFFTPESVTARPELVGWLVSSFWENRPTLREYLKHVAARQRHQTAEHLGRITLPTLVVVGDRDTHPGGTGSHWDQSRYLADHLPRAELRVIPGAAHGLFWEKPQETVDALVDWLDRVESAMPVRA